MLPILVAGFAFGRSLWVSCVLLVMIGTTLLILQSLAITLVQISVPDRVRGRVMTVYSQLHAGSDTVGNVAIGSLAVVTGLPLALGLGAGAATLYALGIRFAMPAINEFD